MFITDLTLAQKNTLAQELRTLIKNETIISENKLRRFLQLQKNISFLGISEIKDLLRNHYNNSTTNKLMSKIKKSVVWDTSICKMPLRTLESLFYTTNPIITTLTYNELLQLSSSNKDDSETSRKIIQNIINDKDSLYSTVVNIPKQNYVDYVDDQLLEFCLTNGYSLYTADQVMGLRARVRNINVSIFHKLEELNIYIPNKHGKNILLDVDLLHSSVSLKDIIHTAELIGANKFILTYEFADALESFKTEFRNLIHFFVLDESDEYSIYTNSCDTNKIITQYNAIIFSGNLNHCINYKINGYPYRFISN